MTPDITTYFHHGEYRIDNLTHISRRNHVVYLEVPKAGCTVIKSVLQWSETRGAKPLPGVSVHQRDASPLAAPLRDGFDLDELFGLESSWLISTFVRNPFSRVLSCYLEKIAGAPRPGQRNLRVHNLGLAPGETMSFREFLEAVAQQRPRKMDIHWAPQARLVGWGKIRPGFIGHFETLQTDVRRLVEITGISVPDDLLTRRTAHTTNARERLEEFYSDARCVALVREIYAQDFDSFGYGRDVRFA